MKSQGEGPVFAFTYKEFRISNSGTVVTFEVNQVSIRIRHMARDEHGWDIGLSRGRSDCFSDYLLPNLMCSVIGQGLLRNTVEISFPLNMWLKG
jgi:hypothetical protein